MLVQDRMEVTVFRRAAEGAAEGITSPGGMLALRSIDFSTRLEAVYEGVKV